MPKASSLSISERLNLILESFQPNANIAELCRRSGISQATFYKWRDRFLEGGKQALSNGSTITGQADAARIEELKKVIGEQTVEIQVLKKSLHLR